MKVITKMELQPDMVLGEDILDQDRVIYPAGTTITPQIIEKLKRYNLVCVTIMEDVDFATTHYAKIRFDTNFKAFEPADHGKKTGGYYSADNLQRIVLLYYFRPGTVRLSVQSDAQ